MTSKYPISLESNLGKLFIEMSVRKLGSHKLKLSLCRIVVSTISNHFKVIVM